MRRDDHLGQLEERRLGARLLGEDVESGPGHDAVADGLGQRLLVDDAAAGRVDDADARLGLGQQVAPEQPDGLGRLGRVDGDEVGLGHQLLDAHQAHPHGPGPLLGDEGVVADELHAEGVGALGHQGAGPSQAHHAEHLAVQLDALPLRALPAPGHQRGVGLGDVAGLRQQQGHGLLGHREDVRRRGVDHHDATLGGRRDVDVVQADAGPPHHLQRGPGGQHLGRHLGGGADDQRVRPRRPPRATPRGSAPPARRPRAPRRRAGRARSARSSRLPAPVPPRWPPHSPRRCGSVLRLGEQRRPTGRRPRPGRRRPGRRTCGSSPGRRTPLRGRPPPWPR